MLPVKKAPITRKECIDDGHATVERQLRNLCSLKLSIGVAPFDDSLVVVCVVDVGKDAVIARLLDGVVNRASTVEVNGLGENQGLGLFIRLWAQDEFADICLITETILDKVFVTDA